MKKVLAILMAILLICSLAACGGGFGSSSNNKVAQYVEKHRDELLDTFESSISSSSGMTCTSDLRVVDNGFIIDVNMNELDNVSDDTKEQLQSIYNSLDSAFESALEYMQDELPELEYFTINVCEKDGDVLAIINAGK